MDPNATLALWRDASLSRGERAEARNNLRGWIARGGFLPAGLTPRERKSLGLPPA